VFFWLTTVRDVGILYLNLTLKIRFEMKDTHIQIDTGPAGRRCALPYLSFGYGLFCAQKEEYTMETRIALISIIVENPDAVGPLNDLLHQYGQYIIGRMGIPYRQRRISIISVAVEAPQDVISALSGKLGRMEGVSAKAAYSNYIFREDNP
jgi:putative iron-only hydrogenase system regulator